jgi:CysZ protein
LSTARLRRPTAPEAFAEGFATPFQGFAYMTRHAVLWRYAVIPIVLNLLITIAIVALTIWAATALYAHYEPRMPEGAWGGLVRLLAVVVLVIAAGGLAVVTWMFLNGVLCGHFYGRLAAQVEMQLGVPASDLRELSLTYQAIDVVRDVSALALINVACLLLNFVPVIGSMTAPFVAFYYDSFIFGMEYLDFPLALRGWRRDQKWAFARRHRWHTVGLGAAVLLCNFVPILGPVMLSCAATGAVLLHRRLQQFEQPARS